MKSILTLKKNYEFKNVLDKGKVYYGNQIIVYINKNKKEKNILGIAINTKLCKANKRNKLKRLIRENYRLVNKFLKQGYNIVFLCIAWIVGTTGISKYNSLIINTMLNTVPTVVCVAIAAISFGIFIAYLRKVEKENAYA